MCGTRFRSTQIQVADKFAGKGHVRDKPNRGVPAPLNAYVAPAVTVEDLDFLMCELKKYRVTPRCYGMLRHLAGMPPAARLAANLRSVLAIMAKKEVANLLVDGFTDDERAVLLEADTHLPEKAARITAYALFDVEERGKLADVLEAAFRSARTKKRGALEEGVFR